MFLSLLLRASSSILRLDSLCLTTSQHSKIEVVTLVSLILPPQCHEQLFHEQDVIQHFMCDEDNQP